MTQSAKPDDDVVVGSWKTPPLWRALSDSTDGTYVYSVDNPQNESFTVALDCVNLPSSGTQTIKVRMRREGTDSIAVLVSSSCWK